VLFFVIFIRVTPTGSHKGGGCPQRFVKKFMMKQQRKRRMGGETEPQRTGTDTSRACRSPVAFRGAFLSLAIPGAQDRSVPGLL